MQFRNLNTRIVIAFVMLLLVIEGVGFALVNAVLTKDTLATLDRSLDEGEVIFEHVRSENVRLLTQASTILSADFGFRQAAAVGDEATIISALQNQGARINADVMLLAGMNGQTLANTRDIAQAGQRFPYPDLIQKAGRDGRASGIVLLNGQLYELIVVPVLAPLPIAWLAMGFRIDDDFARQLKSLTAMDVSFLAQPNSHGSGWRLLATTLPDIEREGIVRSVTELPAGTDTDQRHLTLSAGSNEYVSSISRLSTDNPRVVAVLQSSLAKAMQPLHDLRRQLLYMGSLSIFATIIAGLLIGRGITRPVSQLAGFARRLERGDYSEALTIEREDEIGALGSAFNHMREAIAGRESRIRDLAYLDARTGLPNRLSFMESLEAVVLAAKATGRSVTVLLMDVDRFKEVNDTLGHHVGDLLLEVIAARLGNATTDGRAVLARLGGDEFALMVDAGQTAHGMRVAEAILRELEQPIILEGLEITCNMSIGVAEFPLHASDMKSLLQRAEEAMYVAKRTNSGIAIFDPASVTQSPERLALMGELRRAIELGQLELFFQPKVAMASGLIGEVEALVRWNHPSRGMVSPAEFIPFAENTGYIKMITRWVLNAALAQSAAWRRAGRELKISVNISARDLSDQALPQLCLELLAAHGAAPGWLTLEITESAIMADPAGALIVIEKLHAMGFALSIDDFGTGYSSLAYLKRLPVDELKIDKSFVQQMATDSNDATIVRSTIRLGHDMGLRVVAEGIEDSVSYQLLKDLECDVAQGYYISRPLSAAALGQWLDQAPWRPSKLRLA